MRSLVLTTISMMTLACSHLLPVPDPVPVERDAGPAPCTTTEALAGRCIEGLGEGLGCPTTSFSTDHTWANETVTLRFVERGGTGDGQSASAAAGTIVDALAGIADEATILLGAGTFDTPSQLPAQTTIIGRCAAESVLTIKPNSLITRGQDQLLRLWGLKVDASSISNEETAVEFSNPGRFETHHTRWISGGNAISVQGTAVVQNVTFGTVEHIALGVTGSLSSIIVGDNHFLGPISGEGVFLGPISGEGVFRLSGNTFGQIDGNALSIVDATSSVIVGDNHFLGPISGEGVFLGPTSSDFSIQNNRFERVSGSALVVQDCSGGGSIRDNTIIAQEGATNGVGIAVLDATDAALSITNNQVINATQAALMIVRSSAEITVQGNTLRSTRLPQEVGGNDVFGYGSLILDSGHINLIANTIDNHPTAGVLYDLEQWGNYIRRNDLSGAFSWLSENNIYANNNQHNEVSQHTEDHPSTEEREPPSPRPGEPPLPTARQSGRAACGDGRTSGSELCDPNDPDTQSVCTPDCKLISEQKSASGRGFSCFVGSRHQIYCVASNQRAEILHPGVINPEFPLRDEITAPTAIDLGVHRFVGVAAGSNHACGLNVSGEVICWGERSAGAVGDCQNDQFGTDYVTVKKYLPNNETSILRHVRSIASYNQTTCAVTQAGQVYCWGASDTGQRERDAPANCATQPAQEQLQSIENVSVGDQFICARSTTGSIFCWGRNQELQLGSRIDEPCMPNESTSCSRIPQRIGIPSSSSTIATGKAACAQDHESRKIRCWGPSHSFSLPSNIQGSQIDGRGFLPDLLEGQEAVTHVALGASHGCLVDATSGDLQCWGEESVIWAGETTQSTALIPKRVPVTDRIRLMTVLELTVGHRHTCTLRDDRVVRCWGYMKGETGIELAVERNPELYGELP